MRRGGATMKLIYPAVFYPFSDGSGGYTVEFPDLPGCVTEGNDLEEAFEMAIDAVLTQFNLHPPYFK